jgi:hypothetical protein
MSGSDPAAGRLAAAAADGHRSGPRLGPSSATGAALLAGLLFAGPAAAQPAPSVGLSLTVSHASPNPGPVDPGAARLHERLRDDFRYQSLRVLERRRLDLRTGETGGLDLPSGKRVRVRPLHMGAGGVLLAVDIENTLHTDMRVPDRTPVVIGVDRYDDGKLILTLEPELPPQ